ncbi:retinol dehydrogenase 11-like [Salvia hispanica]|uniref:retinol dehydrogenase 11-like n=1 Tax=Salvia hispanica TaxID=49212 RepID=UPI0020094F0F|nr:retinol dehydrogenase 11-like [Salvia hispanica]
MVYIVCRSKERGEAARSKIQSATGNKNVHLEICDVSCIGDVKTLALRFSVKDEAVHILVNNAGVLEQNRLTTSEGHKMNFAVNVLGTYAMTELMLPLLEKAAPNAHHGCIGRNVHLSIELQFNSKEFNGVEQYARKEHVICLFIYRPRKDD